MDKYIDANELRSIFRLWYLSFDGDDGEVEKHTIATAIKMLDARPAADVVNKERFEQLLENSHILTELLEEYLNWAKSDVRKNVHAEWIPFKEIGDCIYKCSGCGFLRDAYVLEEDSFCPHCGASMRKEAQ